jgi:hypothetical protein
MKGSGGEQMEGVNGEERWSGDSFSAAGFGFRLGVDEMALGVVTWSWLVGCLGVPLGTLGVPLGGAMVG